MAETNLAEQAAAAYEVKDFDKAVELYGDACANYASENGEEDPDLLYNYGKALFQVAIRSSTLFYEDAVDKKQLPVESDNFAFASDDESEGSGDEGESFAEEGSPEEEDGGDAQSAQSEEESEDGTAREEPDADPESSQAGDEEKEEDDFEAAWHVLDVCRALLEKRDQNDKDVQRKLADTYALLGEIAIEDDNYPQAASDFTSALQVKEKLYDADARELSEANYMLGLAYEFKAETPEDSENALKHLKAALRIAKAAQTDAESIKELEQKVTELEAEIRTGRANLENAGDISDIASGIAGRDAIKGVLEQMMTGANDISTLVRKRKPKSEGSNAKKKSKST